MIARSYESLLRWTRGDVEGSRRAAESLLERFGTTTDPKVAAEMAWACARLHCGVSDTSRVLALAQLGASQGPQIPWER